MRIRKHAQISPLFSNGGASVNQEEGGGVNQATPHLCQLNESPWDALAFPLSEYPENPTEFLPPPLPPPPLPPVDGEVSSMENGSISDCPEDENIGLSLILEKWDHDFIHKNRNLEFDENEEMIQEMKSSPCRKKIKERQSNNHPILPKNSGKNPDCNRRGPRPKKPKLSSNPYEFYYYSGFGPRWGKNRGGSNCAESLVPDQSLIHGSGESYDSKSLEIDNAIEFENRTASIERIVFEDSSPDRVQDNRFDYVHDEDEKFVSRKRGRKPIKARSLKSLM